VYSFFDLTTRFRALKHRNFQLFVIGQTVSLIGTWMQNAAQQWLVYEQTSSAALLGVFGFASQVPMLLLAWMGGYVGDRYSRHRGVITTQSFSMLFAFLLAGLTLGHRIQTWHLIFVAFMVGIINAFDVPIRQAFFVHMVEKHDLPNAIALNSSIFNGARIIGPPLAGFAIAYIGAGWCFFLNGVSFIAVIVALLMMRIPRTHIKASRESPIRAFSEGFRFAMTDLPIRSALLLLSTLSLFGLQYSVFLPIYARDILHGDAKTFGLLMSAAGVGAFLGALQFAARTQYKGLARSIGGTCTVCAIGLVVRGGVVRRRVRRDFADGGNQHHHSAASAGRDAQPADGGLRHVVHGRAADRRVVRRLRGQTHGSAACIVVAGDSGADCLYCFSVPRDSAGQTTTTCYRCRAVFGLNSSVPSACWGQRPRSE
jgi:MFS family permease